MNDIASRWMNRVRDSTVTKITFLDWENKVLASVEIPKELKGEERLVFLNAFIRDNFIHPDLRQRQGTDFHDTSRATTYRGKYPYVWEKKDDPDYTREDGALYPLTNKLDYKFVTSPLFRREDGNFLVVDVLDDPYPYLRGFILAANPGAAPWTTLGSAGAPFSHKRMDGRTYNYEPYRGLVSTTLESGLGEVINHDAPPAPEPTAPKEPEEPAGYDDIIEVDDEELEDLRAYENRWRNAEQAAADLLTETGAETLEQAMRGLPTDEIYDRAQDLILALSMQNWAVSEALIELWRRVSAVERRRDSVTDTHMTEEV